MAYKLIWSPAARDDLHDIVIFIARDNPERAMSFGYELILQTDRLQGSPEIGRMVPEYRNPNIRELILVRIGSFIESTTTENCVRSRASGILREEFRYYSKITKRLMLSRCGARGWPGRYPDKSGSSPSPSQREGSKGITNPSAYQSAFKSLSPALESVGKTA
jgi:plasmid stabilization system protein ParE